MDMAGPGGSFGASAVLFSELLSRIGQEIAHVAAFSSLEPVIKDVENVVSPMRHFFSSELLQYRIGQDPMSCMHP